LALFFFPWFFYEFFFPVSSFCIKLSALELCYFFTFLSIWLFQERVGKLTLVNSVFLCFFIELWSFLLGLFFKLFFYLDFISRAVGSLSWLGFFFFTFLYWTFIFFTRSFFWKIFLSRSYIAGYEFIKLARVELKFFFNVIFFDFFFVFIFYIRILNLEFYNF
jgi:hypothetical protein